MFAVLFNPNGRIGPRTFLRGVILLLGAMIVMNVALAYAGPVGSLLSIVSLAVPYAYLCVFGKRLHDAGHSAWWFLAFLAAYVILNSLLQAILMPVLSPRAADLQVQLQLMMEQGELTDMMEFSDQLFELHREGVLTALVSLVLTNIGLDSIAARMDSQPLTNAYGPPVRHSLR